MLTLEQIAEAKHRITDAQETGESAWLDTFLYENAAELLNAAEECKRLKTKNTKLRSALISLADALEAWDNAVCKIVGREVATAWRKGKPSILSMARDTLDQTSL